MINYLKNEVYLSLIISFIMASHFEIMDIGQNET